MSVSSNEYLEYRNDLGTFDGNNVAGLPALLASAMARYRFGAGVSAQAGVSGNGRYFADDANTASTIQFGVLDATLSWDRPIARGSLRAFVQGRNLLNKEYVSSVFINGISGQYFEAGLPLNMNAGVSLRWQ